MRVGFIGVGSMGSLLIDAFISSKALNPEQIFISNRSQAKLQQVADRHAGIHLCSSNIDTVTHSDILFLCIKPSQFGTVINEIKSHLNNKQIVISITSPVQLYHLENHLNCKIAKVIPSITHKVISGASLCMYGSLINEYDKALIEELFTKISKPVVIKERQARITSDISSCGPAFISFFLSQWIEAAIEMTGIDRQEAICLASEMLLGTGKLLCEGGLTPAELQHRVAVPGGITAKALAQLDRNLDGVFHRLITTTHEKYEQDLAELDLLLGGHPTNRPQY